MSSPLATAKRYLTAFATRDMETVASLIGDPFHFKGPMMAFDSATAFTEMLSQMAETWQCEHKILSELEQGDQAVLAYDLMMTAPVPQTVTMFEWLQVKDGKIHDIRLMFDTAAFQMPDEAP